MNENVETVPPVKGGRSPIASPAECISKYDAWAGELDPGKFNPFLRGRISLVGGRALDAILVGNKWINACADADAGTKNALLCLAANYDESPGMIACVLEIAMIAGKPKTHRDIYLSDDHFWEMIIQIYGNDWAGIRTRMGERWGVELPPETPIPKKLKTRSAWRAELGHDVLIHPKDLLPCHSSEGVIFDYRGIRPFGEENDPRFYFVAFGAMVHSQVFLPSMEGPPH
jgi:hypothetical protein